MPELIGLSGYARSGKDTVAGILSRFGYQRIAFADKLKEAVLLLDPLVNTAPGYHLSQVADMGTESLKENFPEYRRLLQNMGTEVGRNLFGTNFWVDIALRDVEEDGKYVITDCRFPNEYEMVTALGGQMWRIIRPGTEPVNGHASETALDQHEFTTVIYNDGTLAQLEYNVVANLTGISA